MFLVLPRTSRFDRDELTRIQDHSLLKLLHPRIPHVQELAHLPPSPPNPDVYKDAYGIFLRQCAAWMLGLKPREQAELILACGKMRTRSVLGEMRGNKLDVDEYLKHDGAEVGAGAGAGGDSVRDSGLMMDLDIDIVYDHIKQPGALAELLDKRLAATSGKPIGKMKARKLAEDCISDVMRCRKENKAGEAPDTKEATMHEKMDQVLAITKDTNARVQNLEAQFSELNRKFLARLITPQEYQSESKKIQQQVSQLTH